MLAIQLFCFLAGVLCHQARAEEGVAAPKAGGDQGGNGSKDEAKDTPEESAAGAASRAASDFMSWLSADSGKAKGRDCSHLSGRQLKDCACKAAMLEAEERWKKGHLSAASSLLLQCDASSPGLSSSERKFLSGVRHAEERIKEAVRLERASKFFLAAEEYQLLFKHAQEQKSPAWATSFQSPFAIPLCRLWGRAMHDEKGSSPSLNKQLGKVAPSMLAPCRTTDRKSVV